MSTHVAGTFSRRLAVVLIIAAVIGTEVSYHFTLDTRFDAIEEKLQQDTVALQQMQDSIDSLTASKTETVSGLNKQLASLQSSFAPLGKTSQAQADALAQLRQQIATLQQAQAGQQDAQKKLSDYIAQLETNLKREHAEAQAAASKPAPAPAPVAPPSTSTAAPAPPFAPTSVPASSASSELMSTPGALAHPGELPVDPPPRAQVVLIPTAPRNASAMALRPADASTAVDTSHARRALPIGAAISAKD